MAYAVARARQAQLLPPETDVKQLEGMFAVYKSNLMAMAQYVTQPYPDPALLVRANEELHRSEGDRTLGWGEVLQGPLEIVVTPGSHYTILTPPQVEILADHLRLALAG